MIVYALHKERWCIVFTAEHGRVVSLCRDSFFQPIRIATQPLDESRCGACLRELAFANKLMEPLMELDLMMSLDDFDTYPTEAGDG